MFKLYKDTQVIVDDINYKISIVRGVWNFSQVSFDVSKSKHKKYILSVFKDFSCLGEISEENLTDELQQQFLKLATMRLIYYVSQNIHIKNILFITDAVNYIENKIKKEVYRNNILLLDKQKSINEIFQSKNFYNIKQNPIDKYEIQEKLNEYIISNNIGNIVIFLTSIDNDYCNLINSCISEEEKINISFCLMDKDFSYLFSVEKLYTGCYACFEKRMIAKMKELNEHYNFKLNNVSTFFDENSADFVYALLHYCMQEYIEIGISPMTGRIATVFNGTYEIKYEDLLRLSFCDECGYLGRSENDERNLKLLNYIKEM